MAWKKEKLERVFRLQPPPVCLTSKRTLSTYVFHFGLIHFSHQLDVPGDVATVHSRRREERTLGLNGAKLVVGNDLHEESDVIWRIREAVDPDDVTGGEVVRDLRRDDVVALVLKTF